MVDSISDPEHVVGETNPEACWKTVAFLQEAPWSWIGVPGTGFAQKSAGQASQQGAASHNDGCNAAGIKGGRAGGNESGAGDSKHGVCNIAGMKGGRAGGNEAGKGEFSVGANTGEKNGAGDGENGACHDGGEGGRDAHNET